MQSWILYKRHCDHLDIPKKERLGLLMFAISISNVLVSCDSEDPSEVLEVRKKGRPSRNDPVEQADEDEAKSTPQAKKRAYHKLSVAEETRYDEIGHWPSMVEVAQRRRRKVCQNLAQNLCTKCDFPLCITHSRNCFVKFQTE